MKKTFLLIGLLATMIGCQGQNEKKQDKQMSNKTNVIKEVLAQQLKNGISPSDHKTYTYTDKDLTCLVPELKKILESNGYRTISKEKFFSKVKEIFGRMIDPNSDTKYLYVNFNDKCNRDIIYNPNDFSDVNGTFIIKGENIISDFFAIPQIIDYQKEYPELLNLENENIIVTDEIEKEKINIPHWRDITDLKEQRKKNIQTLVARNMYFFNNSKAHTNWLIAHDAEFVKKLVTLFGFDEETKFNELVIKDYISNNPESDIKIGNIIFAKNCQGIFEIRDKILSSYLNIFNEKEDSKTVLPLKYFSSYIMELKDNKQFNENEKLKIIAYLADTFDPLFKKYHSKQSNWGQMTILADYKDYLEEAEWQKVLEEYKKSNYYGLSNLQYMIDYANKFDSVGAPD